MPFQQAEPVRKLYEQQRRTGEPSPVSFLHAIEILDAMRAKGRGKAEGSFTEKIRGAFHEWQKKNGVGYGQPLTFQYKLYRHRIVTITVVGATIFHHPTHGKGVKGFELVCGRILSIDGIPYKGINNNLAWGRIIGREKLLALPTPVKEDR